jgi:hypothetical protein
MSTNTVIERSVTVRRATLADHAALVRLATLDSRVVPAGELVVAEVDGALWAAVSASGEAIADPFRHTADLVSLLTLRARQLALAGRAERRAGTVVPARRHRRWRTLALRRAV